MNFLPHLFLLHDGLPAYGGGEKGGCLYAPSRLAAPGALAHAAGLGYPSHVAL